MLRIFKKKIEEAIEEYHIVHRTTNKIHSTHPTKHHAYEHLIGNRIEGRFFHPDYSVYSDSELKKKQAKG